MKLFYVGVLAGLMLTFTPAHAELTGADYNQRYRNNADEDMQTIIKSHLNGIATGFMAMEAYVEKYNHVKVFCLPGKLDLTTDQVKSILDRYIDDHPSPPQKQVPLSLMLMNAFVDVFPCK